MQTEKIYMISDAAKSVKVEAHVLRYWEEELKLPVRRNEMGHRFYTQEDIGTLLRIKELKEEGLQLKAIRKVLMKEREAMQEEQSAGVQDARETALLSARKAEQDGIVGLKQEADRIGSDELGKRQVLMVHKGEVLPMEETKAEKSMRLQQLLHGMISDAVQSNNQEICQEIIQEVKSSILKELDYQFRLQEEKEDEREAGRDARNEEHYKKLDNMLRNYSIRKKVSLWDRLKAGEKKEACK